MAKKRAKRKKKRAKKQKKATADSKKEEKEEKETKEEVIEEVLPEKEKEELFTKQKKGMLGMLTGFFNKLLGDMFKSRKHVKLGLYGPPNGGKTTIANRICKDWLGEEMGSVSHIPHETREVQTKDHITLKKGKKQLSFSLVDTPGIATKIDYEDFIKKGMKSGLAKKRAKEATKGVIDAIKWLDDMDCVIVVLDSTKDPYSQVNITIIGNLAAREIPVLLVANKIDIRKSDPKKISAAFPQYDIVPISAKKGTNIDDLYEALFTLAGK